MEKATAHKSEWKVKFKQWLKLNFSKKHNLNRLIFSAIGIVIALIPSLTCYLLYHSDPDRTSPWSAKFNPDIAFSIPVSTAMIYVLQSFICLVIILIILISQKWYYMLFLSMALLGGLFNCFDRACSNWPVPESVLDYLPTGGTTSNFPDVFVLTGIIGYGVLYVITSIVQAVKEDKHKKKDSGSKTHDKA